MAISLLIVLTTPLTTKPLPKHMHMTSDGLLSVAPGQYLQLTQACMILPFGCVLSLRASDIVGQPQQPLKRPGARHLFIFRDNLDDRDYRRLCRIILSLKQVLCD